MDLSKSNGSLNIPPYFGGGCDKYADWKIYMKIFLSSLDDLLWTVIVSGYSDPVVTDEKSSITTLKPKNQWNETEKNLLKANIKALHCIFTALSEEERQSVNQFETAKEAWNFLEATYEGNKKVRSQKLQQLTLEFETMCLKEDETVDEFYRRIMKVASQCNSLKDRIPEHKLVKKLLRGLPKSYQSKVISIEDAYDLDTLKLDELLGNLKAFEQRWITPEKKTKGVAFKATKKEKIEEDPENLDRALITKQFKQFMKNKNSSGKNFRSHSDSEKFSKSRNEGGSSSRSDSNRFKPRTAPTGPTCFTCGGVGHLAADCGNKKQDPANKSLISTWSDDEEQNVAFVCYVKDFSDSDSDEDFEDEIDFRCSQMYKASKILVKKNEVLEREAELYNDRRKKLEEKIKSMQKIWQEEKEQLEEELRELQSRDEGTWRIERETMKNEVKGLRKLNSDLTDEVKILQEKLSNTAEKFEKFQSSSEKSQQMLVNSRRFGDRTGLGYSGGNPLNTKFVKGSGQEHTDQKIVATKSSSESETSEVKQQVFGPGKRFKPVCHHCGEHGHIRPDCRILNKNNSKIEIALQRFGQPSLMAAKVSTGVRVHDHQPRYELKSKPSVPTCHFCGKLGHIRPRCNLLCRNTQRKSRVSKLNSTELPQAKLKEHMMAFKRIANNVSVLKKQNLKQKQVWVKKSKPSSFSGNIDKLDCPKIADAVCLSSFYHKSPVDESLRSSNVVYSKY